LTTSEGFILYGDGCSYIKGNKQFVISLLTVRQSLTTNLTRPWSSHFPIDGIPTFCWWSTHWTYKKLLAKWCPR
jgi:hypothetical protein